MKNFFYVLVLLVSFDATVTFALNSPSEAVAWLQKETSLECTNLPSAETEQVFVNRLIKLATSNVACLGTCSSDFDCMIGCSCGSTGWCQ